MLPSEVARLVESIASNRQLGALPLALESLRAYETFDRSATKDEIQALHRGLVSAQPLMAAVGNASSLGSLLAMKGEWERISLLRTALSHGRDRVAERAIERLPGVERVLTLSYSSDVLEAVRLMRRQDQLQRVYVCESKPMSEGVEMVRVLSEEGVDARVVPDSRGPSMVGRCDAVLSGADSLLREGAIVNKVGTFPLALACQRFGTPFLALLEVIKTEVEGRRVEAPIVDESLPVVDEGVEEEESLFEQVPGDLVPAVATDGPYSTIGEVLEGLITEEDLLQFYLEEG